jgi:hypothetical protein
LATPLHEEKQRSEEDKGRLNDINGGKFVAIENDEEKSDYVKSVLRSILRKPDQTYSL